MFRKVFEGTQMALRQLEIVNLYETFIMKSVWELIELAAQERSVAEIRDRVVSLFQRVILWSWKWI